MIESCQGDGLGTRLLNACALTTSTTARDKMLGRFCNICKKNFETSIED